MQDIIKSINARKSLREKLYNIVTAQGNIKLNLIIIYKRKENNLI